MNLLKAETDAVFNAPPPKPKSPEKKQEASAEGKKEGEAQGENAPAGDQPDAPNTAPDGEAGPQPPPEGNKDDVEMKQN